MDQKYTLNGLPVVNEDTAKDIAFSVDREQLGYSYKIMDDMSKENPEMFALLCYLITKHSRDGLEMQNLTTAIAITYSTLSKQSLKYKLEDMFPR